MGAFHPVNPALIPPKTLTARLPFYGRRAVREYLHRESNPDQQFRKLLFYPLNYGDSLFSGCKDKQIILFRFFFAILYLFIPAEVITIAYFINFAMDFVRYGTIYSQTNQPPAG